MPRKLRVEYPWSSFGAYLAAAEHRPRWIRVDRLLGEHGIQRDTPEGRQEFERRMERRRLEETDPLKLALAARLRRETTLWLKAIAGRVHWGASKGANTNLHKWMRAKPPGSSAQTHLGL